MQIDREFSEIPPTLVESDNVGICVDKWKQMVYICTKTREFYVVYLY